MLTQRFTPQQAWDLLLQDWKFVDVRAEVEWKEGALPGSVNLPILNDQERAHIGTVYKHQGRETAIAIGHKLVSGAVKEHRLHLWKEALQSENSALYCFRGGQRSQITQAWLAEAGLSRFIIDGGYKAMRSLMQKEIDEFSTNIPFLVLSGRTGSGKTRLLKSIMQTHWAVDLEAIANHRGSSFGRMPTEQPAQAMFENTMAKELALWLRGLEKSDLSPQEKELLVEDESRLIGRCALPEKFFSRLRESAIVLIDEDLESRVQGIYQDYILDTAIGEKKFEQALALFEYYEKATLGISKKLGGLRTQEILKDLSHCKLQYIQTREIEQNRVWIEKLLAWYYDPLYEGSLIKRSPVFRFKGSRSDVSQFLTENLPGKK